MTFQKYNFKYYQPGVKIKYISLRNQCLCVWPPQCFKVTCLMCKPSIANEMQLIKSYFQHTCTAPSYKLYWIVSFGPACSNVTGILPFPNTHAAPHKASRGRFCFCLALNHIAIVQVKKSNSDYIPNNQDTHLQNLLSKPQFKKIKN